MPKSNGRQFRVFSQRLTAGLLVMGLVAVASDALARPSTYNDYKLFSRGEDRLALHHPVEVRSVNGVLNVTLEATEQSVQVGNAAFEGKIYNNEYSGPILRLHPGDMLKIHLVNSTSQPTNLHFHGIDTTPKSRSDNMHTVVQPGESFDYEVPIPVTQPPGLYWYHDHIHGISRGNVMGGLSGMLMVDGFAQQFPELANINLKEQLLALKDYQYDETEDDYVKREMHKFLQSINGQSYSKITMHPQETQIWYLSNQSADYLFNITLSGHKFRVIGLDGLATLREMEVERLKIKPAERVVVLVDAGEAGIYNLTSEGVATGSGTKKSSDRVLGQVVVEGDNGVSVPTLTKFPHKEDMRNAKIDAYRTITFSQANDDEHYFMDGKQFDHERIDTRVPLGNTEEWTIVNNADEQHDFHIHQVAFQVVESDGKPQPFEGYLDSVMVPRHSSVKIRMSFTDPIILGTFMYHCHILKHEDLGMMANIEVYDPALEPKASAQQDVPVVAPHHHHEM